MSNKEKAQTCRRTKNIFRAGQLASLQSLWHIWKQSGSQDGYIWIHLHTYKGMHCTHTKARMQTKTQSFGDANSLCVPVICDCSLVTNPFSINNTFPDPIVKEKIIESAIIGGHIKWHRGLVLSDFNQLRDHRHRFPLFCRDEEREGGQFVLYRRCAQCVFNRPTPVRASHLNEVNVFTGRCVLLSRQPHLAQSSP